MGGRNIGGQLLYSESQNKWESIALNTNGDHSTSWYNVRSLEF